MVRTLLIPPTSERRRDDREVGDAAAPRRGRRLGDGQDAVQGDHQPRFARHVRSSCPERPVTLQGPDTGAGARLAFGHGRLRAHRREPPRPAGCPGLRRGRDPAPHPRVGREGRGPSRTLREDGRAGLPRRPDPRGLGRRRDGLRELRSAVRGAGAGRYRVPGRPERPRRAELAGAPPVGDRRAEDALARAAGEGREACDVRADRARGRHGCGEPGHDGPARRRFLPPERPEDLDQPGRPRRPLPRVRLGRSFEGLARRHGLPARARDGRTLDRHAPRQARDPGRQHGPDQPRRLRRPGRAPDRRGGRGLPDRDERDRPGPVHRGRRRRRARPGLPRRIAQVRPRARDVRPGDRAPSARPADAREDGRRDRDGPAPRVARRVAEEPGAAEHARDVAREVARDRARGPVGDGRDPGPWGERLLERVPGRALPAELEGGRHLRGHEPAPHGDPGRVRAGVSPGQAAPLRAAARPGVGAGRVTRRP